MEFLGTSNSASSPIFQGMEELKHIITFVCMSTSGPEEGRIE